MRLLLIYSICCFFFCALGGEAVSKTLVVEGELDGTVTVRKNLTFSPDKTLDFLAYRFPVPRDGGGAGTSQTISGFSAEFQPRPTKIDDEVDDYGNRFRRVTWDDLSGEARVAITFTANLRAGLSPRRSSAPFPGGATPDDLRVYLGETRLVQSTSPRITELAARLTAGQTTRYGAVNAILNHVADAIVYQFSPPRYDALYGLETGKGNCQNYAHLALALLRASGIPSRLVAGVTLKNKWKVPLDGRGSSLMQGIGEGRHAWIEVHFPDLGWLPCDPQQSRFFTSTRHIKFGHGLDADDIREFWQGSPIIPPVVDTMSARFRDDHVNLRLSSTGSSPNRRYMVSAATLAVASPKPLPSPVPPKPLPVELPKPELKPAPVVVSPPSPSPTHPPKPSPSLPKPLPKPEPTPSLPEPALPMPVPEPPSPKPSLPLPKPAPQPDATVEFGNMEFPTLIEFYRVSGNTGTLNFERETSEYATSRTVYAQAFSVKRPLRVSTVSLAMKKFGGDGMVYLDLVADEDGKPSLSGVRSGLVSLERIARSPGYGWVDFPIAADTPVLPPGKYWIVLRHSGETIMNWFYTPGKGYGGPDDTRSTARGWQWNEVLPYDFVFRVRGTVLADERVSHLK